METGGRLDVTKRGKQQRAWKDSNVELELTLQISSGVEAVSSPTP